MLASPTPSKFMVLEGGLPEFYNLTNPNLTSSCQGNNIPNNSPTHSLEVVNSSQPGTTQAYEVSYNQIRSIYPFT